MIIEKPNIKKRQGRIIISREIIDRVICGEHEALAGWNAIFQDFVVIAMDRVNRFRMDDVEYFGYHPKFDEVNEKDFGFETSLYDVVISREEMEHNITHYSAKFTKAFK